MSKVVVVPPKPDLEVAELFRQFGSAYRQTHALSSQQQKAMKAIEQCRTAALGGHVEQCPACDLVRISYNSCRNRSCPKCQALAKEQWLEARKLMLLPIEYFHVVFTLDHAVNEVACWNQRAIYELLFESAVATLKEFGQHELGGEIGVTAVLHTWGQNLEQHLHLHCLVTGGALSQDGKEWRGSKGGYLFDVLQMSPVFRDKFLAGLARLYREGEVILAGGLQALQEPAAYRQWLESMRAKKWQVFAKATVSAEQVLEYFGRYVNRIAISNQRLVQVDGDSVSFVWKDYRHEGRKGVMTLSVFEFIRRFLLHVLPEGFVRIRHFGLHHGVYGKAKLARCRQLLGVAVQSVTALKLSLLEWVLRLCGVDMSRCPQCGAAIVPVRNPEILAWWMAHASVT